MSDEKGIRHDERGLIAETFDEMGLTQAANFVRHVAMPRRLRRTLTDAERAWGEKIAKELASRPKSEPPPAPAASEAEVRALVKAINAYMLVCRGLNLEEWGDLVTALEPFREIT